MNFWLFFFSSIGALVSICIHFLYSAPEDYEYLNSQSVIKQILQSYVSNAEDLQTMPKNTKIAYGYVADLDIVVNAIDFMNALGQKLPPKPHLYRSLVKKQEFFQTLAHFFQEGAGVEYFIENEEDFQYLVNKSISLAKIKDLGGNAAVMALRGFQENIDILLGCSLDKYFYEELFGGKVKLVSPVEENMTDIHLVLDYFEGEKWGNLVCPRSNRFYLNHDKVNTKLTLLEPFHEEIKKFSPDIIAVGGLHLYNDYSKEIIDKSFSSIKKHLEIDKFHSKIHLEMGSFSNEYIVEALVKNILTNTHSIGFNEQELNLLNEYFKYEGEKSLFYGSDSKDSTSNLINNLILFINIVKREKFLLERIQFHSLNLHAICYKRKFWENPYNVLKKVIIVALQTCKHENSHIPLDDFEFDANEMEVSLSKNISLQSLNTTINHSLDPEHPIFCWDIDEEWSCCYALTPNWISPKRTRGLGDNISSAGLIYHIIKKQ